MAKSCKVCYILFIMPLNEEKISIGIVERVTGLSKDLLRTWERRYGFPTPFRSDNDEREYSVSDLERLKTIKKLLDNGLRPGKIVMLSEEELNTLAASLQPKTTTGDTETINQAINLLKTGDLDAFSSLLNNVMITQGLEQFVFRVAAPMNQAIGDAWFRGELNVFHEHCYSSKIETLLDRAQSLLSVTTQPPRILLTTLSGEQHYLGLLLALIAMKLEHADAIFLGPQLPNSEIVAATIHFCPDIIALSFSTLFPLKRAQQALMALSKELPPGVSIWSGGGHIQDLAQACPEIRFFSSLDAISTALDEWRTNHQALQLRIK